MPDLKYGFVLPFGDARVVADLAREAEQAGWMVSFDQSLFGTLTPGSA